MKTSASSNWQQCCLALRSEEKVQAEQARCFPPEGNSHLIIQRGSAPDDACEMPPLAETREHFSGNNCEKLRKKVPPLSWPSWEGWLASGPMPASFPAPEERERSAAGLF